MSTAYAFEKSINPTFFVNFIKHIMIIRSWLKFTHRVYITCYTFIAYAQLARHSIDTTNVRIKNMYKELLI